MTTALYRRYRPQDFAEVIGQEHVTEPLMQALRSGRVGGRPEDELPWLGEQVQRLRQGALGDQVRRLLSGEAAAWRDPDPALRWSGWIRTAEPVGWLGPVLESLARRAVGA